MKYRQAQLDLMHIMRDLETFSPKWGFSIKSLLCSEPRSSPPPLPEEKSESVKG